MTEVAVSKLDAIPARGQFVILEHQVPEGSDWTDHWDLMFESPVGLLTWTSPPFLRDGSPWEVTPLPVHRAIYLDYEGPISGNRGCVRRLDRGQFRRQDRQLPELVLELAGEHLQGRLVAETHSNGCVWCFWEATGIDSK
ncbi:MAG: hypothetical protein Q8M16_20435 [Pirellulaceae bacterium]|nr:hypothetical protein [Pirellulaceae bacterium]